MTHYAEELTKLKENLLAMASHAETAVSRSMRSLVERDDALAQLRASLELVPVFEIAAKTLAWLEALPADLEPRCRLLVELAPGYADAYLMRDHGPGEECR